MKRNFILWSTTIFFFFLFGIYNANAQTSWQEGWFVNNQGDTLHGYIAYKLWKKTPQNIDFKTNINAEAKKFSNDDVLAYAVLSTENVWYKAKRYDVDLSVSSRNLQKLESTAEPIMEKQRLLLQQLAEGALNLYTFTDNFSNIHFFIQRKSENPKELTYKIYRPESTKEKINEGYKSQLVQLMADCIDMNLEKINTMPYKEKPILQIFEEYNICKSNTVFIWERKSAEKLSLNAVVKGRLSKMKFRDGSSKYKNAVFEYSINYEAGVQLEYPIASTDYIIATTAEFSIKSLKQEGIAHIPSSAAFIGERNIKHTLDLIYIGIKPGLRFYLQPKKKITPFTYIEGVSAFAIKTDNGSIETTTVLSTVTVKESPVYAISNNDNFIRTSQFGFGIGIGVRIKGISIEIGYEWDNGTTPYYNASSSVPYYGAFSSVNTIVVGARYTF